MTETACQFGLENTGLPVPHSLAVPNNRIQEVFRSVKDRLTAQMPRYLTPLTPHGRSMAVTFSSVPSPNPVYLIAIFTNLSLLPPSDSIHLIIIYTSTKLLASWPSFSLPRWLLPSSLSSFSFYSSILAVPSEPDIWIPNMSVDLESLAEATSGAIGSLLSTTILYPLDTCKTRYQAEARIHGRQKYRSLI